MPSQEKKCGRAKHQKTARNTMLRKEKKGVVWFEFHLLQDFPHIRHGCFTRRGGYSRASFDSLNVGLSTGDDPESVEQNKALILKTLAPVDATLIDATQAHTDNIAIITSVYRPQGSCDALVTDQKGLMLMIKHADCQPCILFDPEHDVIACVHAGWKGSVKNIYKKTIDLLIERWNTDPAQLRACIGPSLGPNHSEFVNWKQELTGLENYQFKENHFNFWDISREQLLACGCNLHHIEIAHMCTYTNPELFFSYRRNKVTGRNATCVML